MKALRLSPMWLFLAAMLFNGYWLRLPLTLAQVDTATGAFVRSKMQWTQARNEAALCNDFTRAGFFIRRNVSSNDWIIFLESGGLCFNTTTCNRRFFAREVCDEFEEGESPSINPCRSLNASIAWNETILKDRDPTQVVSPLMTSMECFGSVQEYFPNGLGSSIEGRDILDTDPTKNSLFYSYNHVLIPYCSSDVWLGEETDNTEAVEMNTSECNCFDYKTPSNQNGCFNFNPKSSNLQFTFRGKIIYQSIIEQLLDDYDMMNAEKIIVAGSSAGGLGAINHAKWTRDRLNSTTELRVLFDSAWFIDFQNGIEEMFNGATTNRSSTSSNNSQRLFNVLKSNSACNDSDRFGYPCCISAHCIMTQCNSEGELLYYPKDTPTFALFSIYDIYLLVPGLASVASLDSVEETANSGNGDGGIGVVLDVLRIFGEYGGTMNYTLDVTTTQVSFLSYYLTQCFQHIYFATSTLWGKEGQSVFGTDSIESSGGTTSFRHSITSDRWTQLYLTGDNTTRFTIHDALTSWLAVNGSVEYSDTCQGLLCNPQCPDELRLDELTSNNWHFGIKIFIASVVGILAVTCVLIKLLFSFWLLRLEKKQSGYLKSLDKDGKKSTSVVHKFPPCNSKNRICVSCLDLSYSVLWKKDKAFKNEKDDETDPVLLDKLVKEGFDKVEVNLNRTESDSTHVATKQVKGRPTLVKQSKALDVELQTPEQSFDESVELRSPNTRVILDGISVYFNPGQLVGIMGPSGCGKTTLLDLLTGRKKGGFTNGTVYVNGKPVDELLEWYIANTGYVLQLASPYCEELTVRENLTLAAQMKLPKSMTLREKFDRVEQVIYVTGLLKASNTKVGQSTGPGLSGGQKKRLIIGLQLLDLPSVIFLDEPTSGLDSTASLDLLTHLNKLAQSNRTVVLTIHQPRLEIFHMFHHLVLLSEGKVAYHDRPEKAYDNFVNAVASKYLDRGFVVPALLNVHNEADVIMDMLGNQKMREIITESYHLSREPSLVRQAIIDARWKTYSESSLKTHGEMIKHVLFGAEGISNQSSTFTRMAVLEARADKNTFKKVLACLPFIMFLVFGFVLGTTFLQISQAFLVISGMCVFSTASALFMFPPMYLYYGSALHLYKFEKADGIGYAYEVVIQGFIRFASIAVIPVSVSVAIIYLLLTNFESYNIYVFLQILLVNIALNQTWIALLIALICAFPTVAFRLSPIIAAVAGFSSGFFMPVGVIHWVYRWIFYINPNYFGLSSVAYFVLSDFETDCTGNQLECYLSSGPYVLNQFFFDKINPYLHIVVLLVFTLFYLMLAVLANWAWHTTFFTRLKVILKMKSSDILARASDSKHHKGSSREEDEESSNESIGMEELGTAEQATFIGEITTPTSTTEINDKLSEPIEEGGTQPEQKQDNYHKLWLPEKPPDKEDLVLSLKTPQPQEKPEDTQQELPDEPELKRSLRSRQKLLQNRIKVAQAVLPNEILKDEGEVERKPAAKSKLTLKDASERVIARRRQLHLSDLVTRYLDIMKDDGSLDIATLTSVKESTKSQNTPSLASLSHGLHERQVSGGSCGSIPLDKWRRMVKRATVESESNSEADDTS